MHVSCHCCYMLWQCARSTDVHVCAAWMHLRLLLLPLQAYWLLLCTTVLAGACSSVGSLGASVSVEREWPKVLCGSNTAALSKVNSGLCV